MRLAGGPTTPWRAAAAAAVALAVGVAGGFLVGLLLSPHPDDTPGARPARGHREAG